MGNKKKLIAAGAAAISVSLLCVIFTLVYGWKKDCHAKCRASDQKKQYSMRELVLDHSKKTLIKIHTPEKQYTAFGSVEITEDGADKTEVVLGMRGSIYSEEAADNKKGKQKSSDKGGQPTFLRVYTAEDEIYSFCSQKELSSEIINKHNQIDFYGYLEGYSNGEQDGF